MSETTAPTRPDDLLYARLGRLLLLLASAPDQPYRKPLDIERVGTYDFFADNPHLLFEDNSPERRQLLLAGFNPGTFSYHSASQRFANRRARMQHDLAHLLALGLVEAHADASRVVYQLTDDGQEAAAKFNSSYADSYRIGAGLVVRKLNRLGQRAFQTEVAKLLQAESFVIDLYAPEEDLGDLEAMTSAAS
jgi:hypothetical protein